MHLCDLLFKINDDQKDPKYALWLNRKKISEDDIVKHYRVKPEGNMLKISIPNFESELKGVYKCVVSTADEPMVSTSIEVVINCKLISLQACHARMHTPVFSMKVTERCTYFPFHTLSLNLKEHTNV